MRSHTAHPSVGASPLLPFFALVQRQAVFAISEISRGLAIFFVGDVVTADELAELIIVGADAVQLAKKQTRPMLRREKSGPLN